MTDYDVRKKLEAALRARAAQARTAHPLSHAQRPLLLLHRMNPDSASYHVGFTARFTGGFDGTAFHAAVRSLAGRHPALRTTFSGVDSQTVHGWLEPDFAERAARGWSEQELRDAVRGAYREPFDLAAGPLFRVRVFAVAPGEALVLLTLHHVICDFWSLGIVLAELEQLYLAEVQRRPAQLPAHEARYTDFVTHQRALIDGEKGARARSYWHERLSGRLEPVGWPRSDVDPEAAEGGSVVFPIPAELADGVFALAKAEGATPYAVLLTVFQVLVSRYTGRRDVLVGSPFAGRTDPGLAGCVGNFVNPVVLRADLGDAASYREQLGRTRTAVVEALEHQDYPFELLVSELAPRRVDDRNPIFQAMFSYQKPSRYPALAALYVADEDAAPVAWAGLTAVPFRLDQQDDQLELVLEVVHDGDRLVGLLKYRRAVFSESAAREVTGNYVALLRAALADPGRGIADLPVATEVEPGGPRRSAPARVPAGAAPSAHVGRVTAVWQQVLGRRGIGPDDNFFDLGGNSLLLMKVHELLAGESPDRPLQVPEMFRYPTVAGLARRLAGTAVVADPGRGRASSRRVQLADGTARSARLRARERQRPETNGGKDV
ncbi:condensation domain-containing protein [Amycolatopsis sp. A133]|uniref:condensation domain-containing protein n=1 Tax=Amycolatopsis sp. A133 TaxID=3064472 RepID=UPI0027E798F5|nr:condensation domain-containing protein [Amycolatopsis sp. A133]MDQ7807542.1 condensation domain-containing protein [Amycolatopsis sp. A133]